MNLYDYIYIRENPSYLQNVKLGFTTSLIDRENFYVKREYKRGKFTLVFRVNKGKGKILFNLLQHKFKEYHYNGNGGQYFYNNKIKELIEQFFMTINLQFKKFSEDDIRLLQRIKKVSSILNKINKKKLVSFLISNYKT